MVLLLQISTTSRCLAETLRGVTALTDGYISAETLMRPPSVVLLARAAWLLNEHTIRHDPRNAESVLAMLERCIDTPHTPETRQSILTTLFTPASQFLCDGRIQAQDLLSWIS